MSTLGSIEESNNRALKIHSMISANRDNPNIRMGVASSRYWNKLYMILKRGYFRKPFLANTRNWVRSIVLEDPQAFAFLAPHISLELIVDGKIRKWNGWGSEITRNPDSPIDFLAKKLGPYYLDFLLGNNVKLFKGLLEDL